MLSFSVESWPDAIAALLVLTFFEVVLAIDNLVFLSIVAEKLPIEQRKNARRVGLLFAAGTRVLFLAGLFWLIQFTAPLISIFNHAFSGRDLLLIFGGLFLLYKSTSEVHQETQPPKQATPVRSLAMGFAGVVVQIIILDIVFSFDSLFTAIGITTNFWIIATSIWIAIFAMIFTAEPLSRFIHAHPTVKMLALSFLMLIGTVLIADGFQVHVPKGYIYFAVAFSLFVEFLNTLVRRKKAQWLAGEE